MSCIERMIRVNLLLIIKARTGMGHKRPVGEGRTYCLKSLWQPSQPLSLMKRTLRRLIGPTIRERRQCAAGGHCYLW